jgi:hypothetical protein
MLFCLTEDYFKIKRDAPEEIGQFYGLYNGGIPKFKKFKNASASYWPCPNQLHKIEYFKLQLQEDKKLR